MHVQEDIVKLKTPACSWCKVDGGGISESKSGILRQAIELAYNNIEKGGRPFGAVIVKDGKVIASGVNQILTTNDPTAHAELLAIRAASQVLGTANLEGCSVFASGHPCPMCMAAMRLAGIKQLTMLILMKMAHHLVYLQLKYMPIL